MVVSKDRDSVEEFAIVARDEMGEVGGWRFG
jgi:hypothetical protein